MTIEKFVSLLEVIKNTPNDKAAENASILVDGIQSLVKAAKRIMPKGKENQTELEKITRAGIPNTYEWFEEKFSVITELNDYSEMLKFIMEWQEYMSEKLDEHIEFVQSMIDAYSA